MISINKLHNEIEARNEKKFKTYEKILDLCYQKILNANKTTSDCCCFFACPNVVFGLPLYSMSDCVIFLMSKLSEKGFKVNFTHPNLIFISWIDKNYKAPIEYNSYSGLMSTNYLNYNNTNSNNYNNYNDNDNTRKLFLTNKSQNQKKNYRPIEDYKEYTNYPMENNDLGLLKSKIDDLLLDL